MEGQVGHESTRAVLHPQSLLLSVSVLAHIHNNVDEGSCLGDLPVKTGSIVGGPRETQLIRTLPLVVGGSINLLGQVDFKVSNRLEEVLKMWTGNVR